MQTPWGVYGGNRKSLLRLTYTRNLGSPASNCVVMVDLLFVHEPRGQNGFGR